jgi:hypothetical protein
MHGSCPLSSRAAAPLSIKALALIIARVAAQGTYILSVPAVLSRDCSALPDILTLLLIATNSLTPVLTSQMTAQVPLNQRSTVPVEKPRRAIRRHIYCRLIGSVTLFRALLPHLGSLRERFIVLLQLQEPTIIHLHKLHRQSMLV